MKTWSLILNNKGEASLKSVTQLKKQKTEEVISGKFGATYLKIHYFYWTSLTLKYHLA